MRMKRHSDENGRAVDMVANMVKAKCPHCGWRVKASGEAFLSLALKAHNELAGHNFKFRVLP